MSVQVQGVEELAARLERAGRFVPVQQLVEEAGRVAQERARTYARPHPVDKGTLAEGITLDVRSLEAVVAPVRRVAGIARTVEEGRRPGQRPPKATIGRWAQAHGIGTDPWVLATDIARRGTRGLHMFERAARDAEELLRRRLDDTAARIWG